MKLVNLISPVTWKLSAWAYKNKKRTTALAIAGLVGLSTLGLGLKASYDAKLAQRIGARAQTFQKLRLPDPSDLARIELARDGRGKARFAKVGKKFDRLPDKAKIWIAEIARSSFKGILSAETLARTVYTIDLYSKDPFGAATEFENRAFEARKEKNPSPDLVAEIERCDRVAKILNGYGKMLDKFSPPERAACKEAFR